MKHKFAMTKILATQNVKKKVFKEGKGFCTFKKTYCKNK
jgi:hypothetical protein